MYLAGRMGSLRGQTGFVTQCSFRPHDEESFAYRDSSHDKRQALFSDEIAPLWLIDTTTKYLYPIEQYGEIPNANGIGIVVESLQQRHTYIARLWNRSDSVSLSLEYT